MIQGPSDPSSFSCRLKRPICIASWSLCIRFYFFNFYYALPKTFFFSFLKKRKGEREKKKKKDCWRQHTDDTPLKCKLTFRASMRCAIGRVDHLANDGAAKLKIDRLLQPCKRKRCATRVQQSL